MKVAVISLPDRQAHELARVQSLFAAGLQRFHLRKPGWSVSQIAAWLDALPARWHGRVFLHAHHGLAAHLGVGGIHFPDSTASTETVMPRAGCASSRSCHDVGSVKAALGHHDAVFFGPVFPSLSKPGYGPATNAELRDLGRLLLARPLRDKHTDVFAIGGVTVERLESCRAMGFDGAAILGAVWGAADPVAAFCALSDSCRPRADIPSVSMEAPT